MYDDHQMGWPTGEAPKAKEFTIEMKLNMLDVSKTSPYGQGYEAQRKGAPLGDGKALYPNDEVKKRQWTMGWGAAYADHGPAAFVGRFASGGVFPPLITPGGHEAIMPLRRPEETYCVIAPYAGRHYGKSLDSAVNHAGRLLDRHNGGSRELLVAKIERVVSRQPDPRPPLRVRMPRPGEFA